MEKFLECKDKCKLPYEEYKTSCMIGNHKCEIKIRDIRLYQYNNGTLIKIGRGKTGKNPHIFKNPTECSIKIAELKSTKYFLGTQFLIVEYFGPFKSEILEIVK